jgi:hypothetical protein
VAAKLEARVGKSIKVSSKNKICLFIESTSREATLPWSHRTGWSLRLFLVSARNHRGQSRQNLILSLSTFASISILLLDCVGGPSRGTPVLRDYLLLWDDIPLLDQFRQVCWTHRCSSVPDKVEEASVWRGRKTLSGRKRKLTNQSEIPQM